MKKCAATIGLALTLAMNGGVLTNAASADVLPAKKSGPTCDQGALVTYNAYVSARKAVFAAYEAELARAKDTYDLTLKTGTRTQRKDARSIFLAARATALNNRNLALGQLGAPPKFPVGCKPARS